MKDTKKRILLIIKLLFGAILFFMVIYSIISLFSISNNIDSCRKSHYFTIAENDVPRIYSGKLSNFDINIRPFSDLCGCIKFSDTGYTGDLCIMKSENRMLVASVRYSAPIYYRYDCTPESAKYTTEQCEEYAEKIVTECIPDTVSGAGVPSVKSSENEFLTEKMTFIYPEHPQCEIYVSVRYDTLKVVLFDARKIYFK